MNADDAGTPRADGEPTVPGPDAEPTVPVPDAEPTVSEPDLTEPHLTEPDLAEAAASLRDALEAEALTIAPDERLDAILDEAHDAYPAEVTGPPSHRWVVPAAVAAAALVVVGALWVASRPPENAPVTAGTAAGSTQPSPNPAPAASSVPTVTPTQSRASGAPAASSASATIPVLPVPTTTGGGSTTTADVVSVGLPVYYLGPRHEASTSLALFRELVGHDVPSPASGEQKAQESLRLAMATPPAGSTYLAPWAGITPMAVEVSGSAMSIRLSSGLTGISGDKARLAVQQLVWTSQAAVGKVLPVTFVLADGDTEVAPGYPAARTYTRPTDPTEVSGELSALWIDQPSRGAVLAAGQAIEVTGVASTFEANVGWEVLALDTGSEATIQSGSTTATIAAPERGTFAFTTKSLPAGTYAVRVFDSSAKDGSVIAEQQIPFVVK